MERIMGLIGIGFARIEFDLGFLFQLELVFQVLRGIESIEAM
jgi:hypothetical protein